MQTHCAECGRPMEAGALSCASCGAPAPGTAHPRSWTLGGHPGFGDAVQRSGPAVLVGRIVGIAAAIAVLVFVVAPLLEPYGVFGTIIAVVAFGIAGRYLGEWVARLLLRLLGSLRRPAGGS